jgi:hypothetical protein
MDGDGGAGLLATAWWVVNWLGYPLVLLMKILEPKGPGIVLLIAGVFLTSAIFWAVVAGFLLRSKPIVRVVGYGQGSTPI